jgi:hypothetical protein
VRGEQPVRQGLERARALAAELEAPQRPRQRAGSRRAPRDERAERAQRVLLVDAEQAVLERPPQAARERDEHPRAAVRPRPCHRADRRLGAVPQPQRGLQPAQAPPRGFQRRLFARRRFEREHGDRGVGVSAQVGGRVAERGGAHQPQAVAQGDVFGFEHEPLHRGDDGAEHASGVRRRFELGEGRGEALRIEHEVGGLAPDRSEEGDQRGVGPGAGIARRAAPARLQVLVEPVERRELRLHGGIGRQAPQRSDALGDEVRRERLVAVQGRRGATRLDQVEGDLRAA